MISGIRLLNLQNANQLILYSFHVNYFIFLRLLFLKYNERLQQLRSSSNYQKLAGKQSIIEGHRS